MISFGFVHGFDELCLVGAHRALRDIDITIGHGDCAQVLLLHALAGSGELGNRTCRGSLEAWPPVLEYTSVSTTRTLTSFAHGENVVQTAVTDIIGPAVAADDPDGFLDEQVGVCLDLFRRALASPEAAAMAAGSLCLDDLGASR